jgi:hypothetical protein
MIFPRKDSNLDWLDRGLQNINHPAVQLKEVYGRNACALGAQALRPYIDGTTTNERFGGFIFWSSHSESGHR